MKQLGLMSSGVLRLFTIFLFYLSLCSGSSVAEVRHLEAIERMEALGSQEDEMFFSSQESTSELDTVPIVNPTTPGTGTTTPITESPPAPATDTTTPITGSPPAPATDTTQPTPTTNPTTSSGGGWCIANPSASDTALQVALDYACGYGGADCSALQPGASCYNPNTVRDHASYAFNDYYQKNPTPTSCVFGGTAQLTNTDPSNGNCHYASAKTTSPSIPPPATPMIMTPPTMMSPPTIETPTAFAPPYGVAEPTGEPSSATDMSCSLQLLSYAVGIPWLLLARHHL